ncbi:pyocin knob domain-containing protein [Achromobacter kerstersii]
MANIENINVGLAANDKKGDPLRDAMQKANRNFSALNTAVQGVLDGKGQASGYASLGADGRLLAAQTPIMYAPTLPTTTHDLNTYVTPGTFYQAAVAGATAPTGVNYPVAQVGFLEVIATGNPVQHVYTTREASPRRFWRSKYGTTAWSPWKEASDTSTTLSYQGGMAAAQDLNNYTQRGMWAIASSAIATGGTNFPIGNSGTLVVYSAGYPGGTTANNVNQIYYASNTGQTFTRSLVTTTWTPWVRSMDSSQLGAASGAATLNAAGQLVQNPAPARALGASENLNDITAPGSYYMNSNASATAALNYPLLLAGLLEVEGAVSGNVQIVQRYTTQPVTNPRTFVRLRFASSLTWGAWFELARADLAMTHTYLTSATDANTLVADNTWWSWASNVVVSSGFNFPPAPIASSGILTTQAISPTYMVQTCMMTPGSNRRPIEYRRIGNGATTWSGWRLVSPVQLASDLPTADCGDAYVDGAGRYVWNATAYVWEGYATLLPTTAHDLNTYISTGQYRQTTNAGAIAGSNYPSPLSGYLEVISGGAANTSCKQEYTISSASDVSLGAGPRKFWRMQTATATWSPWQEVLTSALGMTHQFLTAATDANTLSADNTRYTFSSATVFTGGSNWPPTSNVIGGWIEVAYVDGGRVIQTCTLPVSNGKPRVFQRFGDPRTNGVWQAWKMIGPVSTIGWLPTADAGDVYVDGALGVYRWNAALSAYVQSPPTPGFRDGLKTAASGVTAVMVYPGRCASVGGEVLLELLVANTRTIQSSGAFTHSATGNGLLTGARVANTWYYVFLLRRNSDGAVCVAFDTTFNCANRPATHSHYRRVGQILTDVNAEVWAYSQYGNQFWLNTSIDLWSGGALIANGAYSPATYTPPNVAHIVKLTGFISSTGSGALLQRFQNGGGTSAYQYVLTAFPGANSINWWEAPMGAVANPVVSFLVGASPINATVKVLGYIDLFED